MSEVAARGVRYYFDGRSVGWPRLQRWDILHQKAVLEARALPVDCTGQLGIVSVG